MDGQTDKAMAICLPSGKHDYYKHICYSFWLRETRPISGEANSIQIVCIHSEKGSTLKGKDLHPVGANSFLSEKTPLQKGHVCRKANKKLQTSSPLLKWWVKYLVYPFTLNVLSIYILCIFMRCKWAKLKISITLVFGILQWGFHHWTHLSCLSF